MNKDDEFNPYQPDAIDETKALELTQKGQEFKDSIQGLKDNQEKLDGNYESLGNELRGKSQEDIDSDPGGFHKLREDYDQAGIAADENRETLQQKEGEYEKFKEENGVGQGVEATPSAVGNDNVNVGDDYKGKYHATPEGSGHDVSGSSLDGLGDDARREAVEAARPAVDSPPQRDNAFTQLEDSTPTQETPAQEQEQTTTPNQEQAPEQTAQRDNAFTELESSSPTPEPSGQQQEQQATPTADAPEQSGQRDNAFTQLGEANSPDQAQAPAQEQDKER